MSKKKSKENLEKLAQQEAEAAARVDESEADRLAREEHIIATFAHQKEQHAHAKDISVRRGVSTSSRHRRASSPSSDDVGGFFFYFEAMRCSAQVSVGGGNCP